MIVIGIDYSINGPAICAHKGREWSIDNCNFYFMSTVKKNCTSFFDGQVIGEHLDTKTEKGMYPQQRYLIRAEWVTRILMTMDSTAKHFAIEGYSLNSKGKIDAIIENASTLKTLLYLERGACGEFTIYPPTTLKKFATGKGNALKPAMIIQFEEETGWDIHEVVNPNVQFGKGPAADIVDSYFTCKKKFEEMNT